jgi:hypothetical protein
MTWVDIYLSFANISVRKMDVSAMIETQIVAEANSKKSTIYVDVKSETLRDLLREVLENFKAVSAIEPKLSVKDSIS